MRRSEKNQHASIASEVKRYLHFGDQNPRVGKQIIMIEIHHFDQEVCRKNLEWIKQISDKFKKLNCVHCETKTYHISKKF